MKRQIWKPIVVTDHKGNPVTTTYEISNDGQVRSNGWRKIPKKIGSDVNGSPTFQIRCNDDAYNLRVARVVGRAFCPEFHEDLRPVHKDGNRANCAAKNLKWVPRSQVTGIPYSKTPRPCTKTTQTTQNL
jgi:hypothetical protein